MLQTPVPAALAALRLAGFHAEMADFPGPAVDAIDDPVVDHQTAADAGAGAQRHQKGAVMSLGSTLP